MRPSAQADSGSVNVMSHDSSAVCTWSLACGLGSEEHGTKMWKEFGYFRLRHCVMHVGSARATGECWCDRKEASIRGQGWGRFLKVGYHRSRGSRP